MASEPYCADAPSRSTSTCRRAIEGMGEMSGPLGAVGHAAEPDEDGRAVAALAVDEHQGMVVGEVAQARRPDQRRGAADGVGGDVERGDQGPQPVVERGGALAGDVPERNRVDGNRRRGHRPRLRAAAHDDHLLFELHREGGVQGHRGPGSDRHAAARFRAEAGQRERDVVSAGRKSGERERPGAAGDGDGHRAAGLCGGLDGHARQHEARGVGDRAFDGRVPPAGRERPPAAARAGNGLWSLLRS